MKRFHRITKTIIISSENLSFQLDYELLLPERTASVTRNLNYVVLRNGDVRLFFQCSGFGLGENCEYRGSILDLPQSSHLFLFCK